MKSKTNPQDSHFGVDPLASTAEYLPTSDQHQYNIEATLYQTLAPLNWLCTDSRNAMAAELRLAIEPTTSMQTCMRVAAQRCIAWQDPRSPIEQRARRVVAAAARTAGSCGPLDAQQQKAWRIALARMNTAITDRSSNLIMGLRYHRIDSDFELAAGAQMLNLSEQEVTDRHNAALDATYSALCAMSAAS